MTTRLWMAVCPDCVGIVCHPFGFGNSFFHSESEKETLVKTCSHCQKSFYVPDYVPDAVFCPYCGEKMPLICSNCGEEVEGFAWPQYHLCEKCGGTPQSPEDYEETDEECSRCTRDCPGQPADYPPCRHFTTASCPEEDEEPRQVSLGDPNDPMSLKAYE